MSKYKTCSRCKQSFPATNEFFPKQSSKSDGLAYHCKSCDRLRCRNYDTVHRDKRRGYTRQNASNEKDRHAKYYKINRERILNRNREWAKNNPDNLRARAIIHVAKRKARKRGLPDLFTRTQWKIALDYFNNCCVYCDKPQGLWTWICADHYIPLDSAECPGTVAHNMLPACNECNSSKCNRNAFEWMVSKFGKKNAILKTSQIQDYFAWMLNGL